MCIYVDVYIYIYTYGLSRVQLRRQAEKEHGKYYDIIMILCGVYGMLGFYIGR